MFRALQPSPFVSRYDISAAKIFQAEVFRLEYFQNIDWLALGQKLIIPACIMVFALFVGVVLNQLLIKKLAGRVKASESEIVEIFFRALRGVPIYLCIVIGLYWSVTTSNLPAGLEKIFSYILFAMIVFAERHDKFQILRCVLQRHDVI